MILPRAMQIRQVRHHLTGGRPFPMRDARDNSLNVGDTIRTARPASKCIVTGGTMKAALSEIHDDKPSQTAELASFAARLRFEDLPADVIEKAKICFRDALACCLFGVTQPWTRNRPGDRRGRQSARGGHRQQASHQRRSSSLHRRDRGSRFRARRHPWRGASARRVARRSGGARSCGTCSFEFGPQCHRGDDRRL
jgi:hypothetical protein